MTKLFQKSYVNTRESQEEYGVYHIPKSWIKSKNSKKKCLIMKGNNTGGWSLTRQRCNVWYELAVRNIIHKKIGPKFETAYAVHPAHTFYI